MNTQNQNEPDDFDEFEDHVTDCSRKATEAKIAETEAHLKRVKNWQISTAVGIWLTVFAAGTALKLLFDDNQSTPALAIVFAFGAGMLITIKRPVR